MLHTEAIMLWACSCHYLHGQHHFASLHLYPRTVRRGPAVVQAVAFHLTRHPTHKGMSPAQSPTLEGLDPSRISAAVEAACPGHRNAELGPVLEEPSFPHTVVATTDYKAGLGALLES